MRLLYLLAAFATVFNLTLNSSQTSHISAASAPDFSGTWQLDRRQSTNIESLRLPDMNLSILQSDLVLKVTRTLKGKKKDQAQELTYYSDGRGEKNPTIFGSEKRESKSSWSNGKLISKFILSTWTSASGQWYSQQAMDIWELSNDGQTLTITTEVSEGKNIPEYDRDIIKARRYQKVFKKVQ